MNQALKFLTIGSLGLLLFFCLFSVSCTKEIQNIPVIESFSVSPDTVIAGDIALLTSVATDADNEDLVYSYNVSAGQLSGYGDSVYWLTPLYAGIYNSVLRVTDPNGNQSIDSVKLVVLSSGMSTVSGTASFPEGVNFDLSDAKVRLFASIADRNAGHSLDSTRVFGFGSIVSFKFPAVEPGTYYMDVWKDMDNSYTISTGDFIGWYGSGDFVYPNLKPLVVQDGMPVQAQIQVAVKP